MTADFLYRNPRLLILIVATIAVAGFSAFFVLPRTEDPVLGRRVAVVTTAFPGADAERVESLVTKILEEGIRDIAEIKEVQSSSRAGISNIVIELRDEVTEVAPVWSQVRDRLSDASLRLPAAALKPDFQRIELKAFAAIVALKWTRSGPPSLAILRRLANNLKSELRNLPGTQDAQLFGDPGEEVLVELKPELLAALGLSIGAVAQQIQESDASQPAGLLRGAETELLLDVDARMGSVQRLGQTPIQYGAEGRTTSLADIASIQQQTVDPPPSLAMIDGEHAVVVGVLVRDDIRIDHWSERMRSELETFRIKLPPSIELDLIFSQNLYVEKRLNGLLWNLLQGMAAVTIVVFLLMGWRSTIVVATALPLSALMVLSGMRALGIPIHQMSVTGLIIALGLLIDNAIVIVEEVRSRIWAGLPRSQAIRAGVRHLAMPLFGSSLTTTLAFTPIALLPGPPGEFVGSIALSVILAINSSFLLALTVVPAMTALLQGGQRSLFNYGFRSATLAWLYEGSLSVVLRVPLLGVILGAALPLFGFLLASRLPEQFFPAADRDQIQIEIELAPQASLAETQARAEAVRRYVMRSEHVTSVNWFLGESAPTFYYNVVPRRRGVAFYGQALVQLTPQADTRQVVQDLQRSLTNEFADCRLLVRQLEQGPPFEAPIEVRLRGPDLSVLKRLGSELRLVLTRTTHVLQTRSDVEESLPKLVLLTDEHQTRAAGLSHNEIGRQLYSIVEGVVGGRLLRGGEDVPIRVRLADRDEISLEQLASLELPARRGGPPPGLPGRRGVASATEGATPLSALAKLGLASEGAAITHINGERMNEVKAYITAGTLPSDVLREFERRLGKSDFRLPSGYTLEYGGESAKRDEAVTNLLAAAVVLFALMLLTLVVSFRSFRIAFIIALVGGLSIGLGPGALACFGYPFGFMAIVGTMGLVGVAINDAIVVMAGIRSDDDARAGNRSAIRRVVVGCTRHVLATTFTTIAGFLPLLFGGGRFWPPLAITIGGGIGGATLLALYFVPALYLLLLCRKRRN